MSNQMGIWSPFSDNCNYAIKWQVILTSVILAVTYVKDIIYKPNRIIHKLFESWKLWYPHHKIILWGLRHIFTQFWILGYLHFLTLTEAAINNCFWNWTLTEKGSPLKRAYMCFQMLSSHIIFFHKLSHATMTISMPSFSYWAWAYCSICMNAKVIRSKYWKNSICKSGKCWKLLKRNSDDTVTHTVFNLCCSNGLIACLLKALAPPCMRAGLFQ